MNSGRMPNPFRAPDLQPDPRPDLESDPRPGLESDPPGSTPPPARR